MAARKSSKRKYSKGASKKVGRAMRERKKGTLRSGRSKKKVTSRKQATAIGLSEARAEGKKVPPRGKKKASKKRTAKKSGGKRGGARKTAKRSSGAGSPKGSSGGRKASRRR